MSSYTHVRNCKHMPYFSIIIPTYNRVNMLPRCLDSVLNQTFTDFEVIVVDNYSEDGSKELIDAYCRQDSRVHFIQVHNNGVIAHSRNVGIKTAKGNYIAFLDSDDWYREDKLEKSHQIIMQSGADLIYHPLIVTSSKGEKGLLGKPLLWEDKYLELLIEGDKICNSSVVVRKSVLESIGFITEEPELVGVEDFDCWLRIAKSKYNIAYTNDPLGYYWEGDNLSSSEKQVQRIDSLYQKHLPNIGKNMRDRVLYAKEYRQARIMHNIGLFSKAIYIYKSLFIKYTSKKDCIKILLFLIFAILRIKK